MTILFLNQIKFGPAWYIDSFCFLINIKHTKKLLETKKKKKEYGATVYEAF